MQGLKVNTKRIREEAKGCTPTGAAIEERQRLVVDPCVNLVIHATRGVQGVSPSMKGQGHFMVNFGDKRHPRRGKVTSLSFS